LCQTTTTTTYRKNKTTRWILTHKFTKTIEKQLKIHHTICKAIYTTQHNNTWRNHPTITDLPQNIPKPPLSPTPIDEWIKELAQTGTKAKKEAQSIIQKHTTKNIHKAIKCIQNTLDKTPKKGHNQIFKETEQPSLDSLKDRNNNILIHPYDISKEIHAQQTINSKPTTTTCHYQENHPNQCTCAVKQYPWHDIDGFILEKRRTPNIPIYTYFTREVYDLSK
jgi:hypothetical protein